MPTNINKLACAGCVIDIHMWPSKINESCGKNNKSISSKNHTTVPFLLHRKMDIVSPHEYCIDYCPRPVNLPYLGSNDPSRSMEVASKLTKSLAKNVPFSIISTSCCADCILTIVIK